MTSSSRAPSSGSSSASSYALSIPRPQRAALAVLTAATLMTIVDETVVSVATPRIQVDLGFSTANLSWIVNAYLVAFGSLLLLGGRLGDLIGRRRVLLMGLTLFTLASVVCAAAWSPAALIVARFAQGAGGALAASVALGMVNALFDDPAVRGRAIGIYAAAGASGASIGLVVGGLITSTLGWRWAFLINAPLGTITVIAGTRLLTRDRGPGLRSGADGTSAVLLAGASISAILAIVDPHLRLAAVPAVLLLAGFSYRQRRSSTPLLPPRLLRSRRTRGANLTLALLVGAMFGFQFLIALYLQSVLGYTPAQAGAAVVPVAAGVATISLVVLPRLVPRYGHTTPLLSGLPLVAAGLFLLTRVPVDGHYLDILPSVILFALGGGLTLPSVIGLGMSEAAPDDAGLASGLINTSQQVGGALGLAVLTALAAQRSASTSRAGASAAEAAVAGYHTAWTIGGFLVLAALAVAAVTLRHPKPSAVDR